MIKVWIDSGKSGGHEDLLLQLESINLTKVADTYYFTLDNSFRRGDESTNKVYLNLKQLLEGWVSSIRQIESGETVCLPFDFSDQYIGCLKVAALENGLISVNYGYTVKYIGSSFNPSRYADFILKDDEYKATTESFTTSKTIFLEDIKQSVSDIVALHNTL